MTRLFLVRHGKTELSGEGKYYGRQDVKLSVEGIEQAEKLRDYLVEWQIDHVYCSSLSRAIDTAGIVAAPHGKEIMKYSLIDEMDVGHLEGLTFDDVRERYPELSFDLLNWTLPAAFPGGESLEEFAGRVEEFAALLKEHEDDESVLVVAHAGSLRSLLCHFLGLENKYWMLFHIDFTSLSIVDLYSGRAIVRSLNNISHLTTAAVLQD